MESAGEELANIISHGIGFVAALIGAPILLLAVLGRSTTGFFIGTIVFATTMSILYLSSTLYHAWPSTRGKSLWRVIDHSAIFLLIAGTYTPFGLGPLRASGGLVMLAAVWTLAIFGVAMKATRGTWRHPKLSMSLYLGTGWLGLVVIRAARFGDSAVGPALVGCRRDRLHNGHIIFCEQTPALFAFYLAPVRPRRHELPLYRGNFLRSLTRIGQDESAR